jgi:hypothetical protein
VQLPTVASKDKSSTTSHMYHLKTSASNKTGGDRSFRQIAKTNGDNRPKFHEGQLDKSWRFNSFEPDDDVVHVEGGCSAIDDITVNLQVLVLNDAEVRKKLVFWQTKI